MASAVRSFRLAWNNVDLDLTLGSVTLLSFERPLICERFFSWATELTRTLKTP
jgi:hypothetical protein